MLQGEKNVVATWGFLPDEIRFLGVRRRRVSSALGEFRLASVAGIPNVVISAHLVSRLIGTRVNQRMRNKICGRRGSDLRVDLIAAIRVSLTARHALHFDGVGRLQDVSDGWTIWPEEIKEDGTLAPGGFAVDDPINIVGHAASFFPSQASLRE